VLAPGWLFFIVVLNPNLQIAAVGCVFDGMQAAMLLDDENYNC
jgi:hypothetical protein